MAKDVFSAKHFHDDEAACRLLEDIRWSGGRVCPHCGVVDHSYETKRRQRNGSIVYRCAEKKCRKDFTVTTKSVMESSHIALHKWLQGFYQMSSSKKGISSHQLHRSLRVTYKAAWFMTHRIREAMRAGGLVPMGGEGKIVEADETYYGRVDKANIRTETTAGRPFTKSGKTANKRPIVALVERGGSVRTFHVAVANAETVGKIVMDNVARESRLHTDESRLYPTIGENFAAHRTVKHSAGEYARMELDHVNEDESEFHFTSVHTNNAEGYFGVFKKGMRGVYQHCAEKHLHRYLSEFDFRFNNRVAVGVGDVERTTRAIAGAAGKRLTYH
jgi:transposase-like protein